MKLLHLDSSILGDASASRQLSRAVVDAWKTAEPTAQVTYRDLAVDAISHHDRLQGYRDGLAEVGLSFEPELVLEGDFTQPTGFRQTQALLQLPERPTAIIASNDLMAFGTMDAAKAAGLQVGQDLSVIGFDDVYMASQVYPPLTTIRQPMFEMGEAAFEMLVALLEGRKMLTVRRELPTELIIRESTGRVSQS